MYTESGVLPQFVPSPWTNTPIEQLPTIAVRSILRTAVDWLLIGYTPYIAAHHCGLPYEQLLEVMAHYPKAWDKIRNDATAERNERLENAALTKLEEIMYESPVEKFRLTAAVRISRVMDRKHADKLRREKQRIERRKQKAKQANETPKQEAPSAPSVKVAEPNVAPAPQPAPQPKPVTVNVQPATATVAPVANPAPVAVPVATPAKPVAASASVPVTVPNQERPVTRQRNRAFQRAMERDLRKAQKTAQ